MRAPGSELGDRGLCLGWPSWGETFVRGLSTPAQGSNLDSVQAAFSGNRLRAETQEGSRHQRQPGFLILESFGARGGRGLRREQLSLRKL